MKYFPTIFLVILLFSTSAHAGEGEAVGTLLGAGSGAFIGNQFGHGSGRAAATIGGGILGGAIGNGIGHAADRRDAIPYNQPNYYSDPQPVYYYPQPYVPNYVAPPALPPETLEENPADYCREYSQLVRVGDQFQETYGTACLQPDGSWKAVN